MNKSTRYSAEDQKRAVWMVFEHQGVDEVLGEGDLLGQGLARASRPSRSLRWGVALGR